MKSKRLRRNPEALLWLASIRTKPAILGLLAPKEARRLDHGVYARARLLAGDESKRAARALAPGTLCSRRF